MLTAAAATGRGRADPRLSRRARPRAARLSAGQYHLGDASDAQPRQCAALCGTIGTATGGAGGARAHRRDGLHPEGGHARPEVAGDLRQRRPSAARLSAAREDGDRPADTEGNGRAADLTAREEGSALKLLNQRVEVGAAGAGTAVGENRLRQLGQRRLLVGDVLVGDVAADDRDVTELKASVGRSRRDLVMRDGAVLGVRTVGDDAPEPRSLDLRHLLDGDLRRDEIVFGDLTEFHGGPFDFGWAPSSCASCLCQGKARSWDAPKWKNVPA